MNRYLRDIIYSMGSLTCVINRLVNLVSCRHSEEVKKAVVQYADIVNSISFDIAEINKSITSTEEENNEKNT